MYSTKPSLIKRSLRTIAKNWPYFDRYGFYSLFPIFFASGVCLELFMIKFRFQSHSFYRTFNKRRLEDIKEEIEEQERTIKELIAKLESK